MMRGWLVALVLLLAPHATAEDECSGPLGYYPVGPCRWFDTRVPGCIVGGGCWEGPYVDGQTRRYLVQSAATCSGVRVVPFGACTVVLRVTATQATNRGHLLLFNGYIPDWERPLASSLNFGPGQTIGNVVIVELGQDLGPGFPILPDLAVYARVADGGSAHVIADIHGYFAPEPD